MCSLALSLASCLFGCIVWRSVCICMSVRLPHVHGYYAYAKCRHVSECPTCVSDTGLIRANSGGPSWRDVQGGLEGGGGAGGGAVSGAASQVPRTLSADHLRRTEREREREGGRREVRRGETFAKQNTKTWGHKSVREAFRSHAGSRAREKPNCPLWHKSHSAGTGCCLRDVPDPSALHCGVCVSVRVRACLAQCWLSGKFGEARLGSRLCQASDSEWTPHRQTQLASMEIWRRCLAWQWDPYFDIWPWWTYGKHSSLLAVRQWQTGSRRSETERHRLMERRRRGGRVGEDAIITDRDRWIIDTTVMNWDKIV